MDAVETVDRIRSARDHALEQEQQTREHISRADTVENQKGAGLRLATRQDEREAFDDVLGEDTAADHQS